MILQLTYMYKVRGKNIKRSKSHFPVSLPFTTLNITKQWHFTLQETSTKSKKLCHLILKVFENILHLYIKLAQLAYCTML